MNRRNFLYKTAAVTSLAGVGSVAWSNTMINRPSNSSKFQLNYAPAFEAFPESAGKDPIDAIKFCSDQGFTAMFDNGLIGRTADIQEKIASEMSRRKMAMGPFVLYADFKVESMVLKDPAIREMLIKKVKDGIELCKRTGFKQALMVPGRFNLNMAWDYQTANVIDIMRELSDIAEKGGMTIVLEPLNKRDHPGLFLSGMPQTYVICRAVNSKACKIVDDLYHQQITEGNLIPNIDSSWSEIGAFHLGDNPGRREPGTGEINFLNVFKHLKDKGYNGVLCMEHGKSKQGKEGELALIEAYRKADNF